MAHYYVIDVAQRKSIQVDSESILVRGHPIEANHVAWVREGFRFVRYDRGYKNLQVCAVGPRSGSVKVVYNESSESFLNDPLIWNLETTPEFIISSERDGWNHLYLYNETSGELVSRISIHEGITAAFTVGSLCIGLQVLNLKK